MYDVLGQEPIPKASTSKASPSIRLTSVDRASSKARNHLQQVTPPLGIQLGPKRSLGPALQTRAFPQCCWLESANPFPFAHLRRHDYHFSRHWRQHHLHQSVWGVSLGTGPLCVSPLYPLPISPLRHRGVDASAVVEAEQPEVEETRVVE